MLAALLAALEPPMPVAIGVILDAPGPSYEARSAGARGGSVELPRATTDLNALLRQGATWTLPSLHRNLAGHANRRTSIQSMEVFSRSRLCPKFIKYLHDAVRMKLLRCSVTSYVPEVRLLL